jgi:hypothetical protein
MEENPVAKRLMDEKKADDNALLSNLKSKLPELEKLLEKVNSEWNYEDGVYRFYHHSFKVFHLQDLTKEIVEQLRLLSPEKHPRFAKLNADFMTIYHEGVGKVFSNWDNSRWLHTTRPIVEAFLHAKYFLEMAVKNGKEITGDAPNMLPSGWAAFLYLYDMR